MSKGWIDRTIKPLTPDATFTVKNGVKVYDKPGYAYGYRQFELSSIEKKAGLL